MNSDDHDYKFEEKEYPFINSPYFAQKVVREIRRQADSPAIASRVFQSKYTYWVVFVGLVLFPALVEANSLRSLCFY